MRGNLLGAVLVSLLLFTSLSVLAYTLFGIEAPLQMIRSPLAFMAPSIDHGMRLTYQYTGGTFEVKDQTGKTLYKSNGTEAQMDALTTAERWLAGQLRLDRVTKLYVKSIPIAEARLELIALFEGGGGERIGEATTVITADAMSIAEEFIETLRGTLPKLALYYEGKTIRAFEVRLYIKPLVIGTVKRALSVEGVIGRPGDDEIVLISLGHVYIGDIQTPYSVMAEIAINGRRLAKIRLVMETAGRGGAITYSGRIAADQLLGAALANNYVPPEGDIEVSVACRIPVKYEMQIGGVIARYRLVGAENEELKAKIASNPGRYYVYTADDGERYVYEKATAATTINKRVRRMAVGEVRTAGTVRLKWGGAPPAARSFKLTVRLRVPKIKPGGGWELLYKPPDWVYPLLVRAYVRANDTWVLVCEKTAHEPEVTLDIYPVPGEVLVQVVDPKTGEEVAWEYMINEMVVQRPVVYGKPGAEAAISVLLDLEKLARRKLVVTHTITVWLYDRSEHPLGAWDAGVLGPVYLYCISNVSHVGYKVKRVRVTIKPVKGKATFEARPDYMLETAGFGTPPTAEGRKILEALMGVRAKTTDGKIVAIPPSTPVPLLSVSELHVIVAVDEAVPVYVWLPGERPGLEHGKLRPTGKYVLVTSREVKRVLENGTVVTASRGDVVEIKDAATNQTVGAFYVPPDTERVDVTISGEGATYYVYDASEKELHVRVGEPDGPIVTRIVSSAGIIEGANAYVPGKTGADKMAAYMFNIIQLLVAAAAGAALVRMLARP